MSDARVTVKGDEQLRRSLKRAGSDVEQMGTAHAKVSALVASAARAPRRTGVLASSVRPAPRPDAAVVQAEAPYGRFVEYGTRRARAQPFLMPAFEATRPAWTDLYAAELQTIVDRVEGA